MCLLKHNTLGSTILEKPNELPDIVTLRNKRKVGKVLIDSLRYVLNVSVKTRWGFCKYAVQSHTARYAV